MKVIILDEPTKGVDVGAKAAIFEIMNELARRGTESSWCLPKCPKCSA